MSTWQIASIAMILALGFPVVRDLCGRAMEQDSGWFRNVLLVLPLALVTVTPTFGEPLGNWALVFYAGLLFVLAYFFRNDWIIILAAWAPLEFGWITKVPGAPEPTTVGLLALLFVYLVGYPNRNGALRAGYSFLFRFKDVGYAAKGFGVMLLVALPWALYLNFVQWPPRGLPIDHFIPLVAKVYLFALAEEVLFRGLIQHAIEARFGKNHLSLGLASVIFGAAHLNNGVDALHWSTLNWKYAALATLAGVVYGLVWRWSGRVTVSALTHTGVNLVRALF